MDIFQSLHWKFVVVLCLLVLGGETVGKNADLTLAKKRKKDEFYTQLVDIENEVKHYRKHFKGATVLCNCDDASELWSYFSNVITWIEAKFKHTTDRVKILKGLDWGVSSGVDEPEAGRGESVLPVRRADCRVLLGGDGVEDCAGVAGEQMEDRLRLLRPA